MGKDDRRRGRVTRFEDPELHAVDVGGTAADCGGIDHGRIVRVSSRLRVRAGLRYPQLGAQTLRWVSCVCALGCAIRNWARKRWVGVTGQAGVRTAADRVRRLVWLPARGRTPPRARAR